MIELHTQKRIDTDSEYKKNNSQCFKCGRMRKNAHYTFTRQKKKKNISVGKMQLILKEISKKNKRDETVENSYFK